MDTKEIKYTFNKCSVDAIKFLDSFSKTTYISTLLVENTNIIAHQSNGYADWDKKFYYDGLHKNSLLIKVGIELTKIKKGEISTVIWDECLKTEPDNAINIEREKHNIYHGVSFIYGVTDSSSLSINVCTGKDTTKMEFENFLFPMRFELLNFFKELSHV